MSENANEDYRLPIGRCVCCSRKLGTEIKNLSAKGKGVKVLWALFKGLYSMLIRRDIFTCKIIEYMYIYTYLIVLLVSFA